MSSDFKSREWKINTQNQQNQNLVLQKRSTKLSLARITEEKRKNTQIIRIRNESGDIITNFTEIKRIVRYYYEQLSTKQIR